MSVAQIMERIMLNPFDDVTFSGGDPMFQAEGFTELAKAIHQQTKKNIWCYTGYLLDEELLKPSRARCDVTDEILSCIDVLVDGEFVEEKKNISLNFRGSENQRLIDLPLSLSTGKICLINQLYNLR